MQPVPRQPEWRKRGPCGSLGREVLWAQSAAMTKDMSSALNGNLGFVSRHTSQHVAV